jgi:ankyrin repeat protein
MTSQTLPDRPSLEQLKKQAKSLLHAGRAKEPAALQRFRILPRQPADLALHDAQFVIAREHGFKSWNELREHVEERTLSFAAAVEEFVRCATGSAPTRAMRLLTLHPGIAHVNLQAELVLGDADAVRARLEKDPGLARAPGGIQNWEPLLYACHTCLHHSAPERAAGLVEIARVLLAHGANPNAEYHWNWHRELPRTALWAALCATSYLPLAQVLLEGGANPTDGVSTHITAGSGNLAALELLHRFGLNVDGIPGGLPPLRYILGWADKDAGVRWLLEHGANPNLPWGELNDAPLHIAAQRWDVSMVELLVKHGADIQQRRADGRTAHTLAELHGNREIAGWLLAHGARNELSALERFIALCARGDRSGAEAMLRAEPTLRNQLRREHHLMMHVPAERGDAHVLDAMLACGFDPNVKDTDGVTALHRAAMAGHKDAARVLIAHGAAVNALDGMFSGTPLLWAAEGWSHGSDGADFVEVARVLIAAGSSREWNAPEKAPDPEGTHAKLAELCRAAGT